MGVLRELFTKKVATADGDLGDGVYLRSSVPEDVQDSYGRPISPTLYAHAPKGGVTIKGKRFEGGEFIPTEVLVDASPEERRAVESGESRGKPLPPEGGVKEPSQTTQLTGTEVKEYQSGAFFDLNQALWDGTPLDEKSKRIAAGLDKAAKPTKTDASLYRAILPQQAEIFNVAPGTQVTLKGYTSLGPREIADDYGGRNGAPVVRVDIPKGSSTVKGTHSALRGEQILPRDTVVEVLGRDETGAIAVRVVPSAVESGESRGKPLPPEGGVREPKQRIPLTDFQKWAIKELSHEGFTRVRSQIMNPSADREWIDAMTETLDQLLPTLPRYDGPVFRGVAFDSDREAFQVLDLLERTGEFSDPSYMSTSKGVGIAQKFVRNDPRGIMFRIQAPRSGADLKSLAEHPNEEEVVIPRGQRFKVVSVKRSQRDGEPSVVDLVES